MTAPPRQPQREPWWVVALAVLGFLGALALFALVYLSELAPDLLRSFLFG